MYNIKIKDLATISYNNTKDILSIKFEQKGNIKIEKINKIFSTLKPITQNSSELTIILELNSNTIYSKEIKEFLYNITELNVKNLVLINKNTLQNTFLNFYLLGPLNQLKNKVNITIVKNIEEAIQFSNKPKSFQ